MIEFGSKKEDGLEYLDMKRMPEYTEVSRVAYVHDVQVGQTRFQDGFVKFYLKDCNANLVVARMFQVEDFLMSGVKAAAFKHRPIVFKCIAQEFNGSLSLIVSGRSGVSLYTGEFDYRKFVGEVDSDLSGLRASLEAIGFGEGWEPDPGWVDGSIDELAFGRAGGFGKIVEVSYKCLFPFITETNREELLRTFVVTMEYWFRFLDAKQRTAVIGDLGAFELLNEVTVRYHDDNCKLLYLDALRAVIGVAVPMHFYAHLIKGAVQYAMQMTKLSLKFDSQVLATKSYVGGVELSKY